MNYESGFARDAGQIDYGAAQDDVPRGKRRRGAVIVALLVMAAIAIAAYFAFGRNAATPAAKGAAATSGAAEGGNKQVPTVSVIVPGLRTVDAVISATGNLAARREMPVGVAGEGGMVTQVLVEPGQWVGAGQVLATIDRRVQTQQAGSLAAQIAVAQADARLAQSELDRAQQLVARGFISKADIDRKVATRDSARARVKVAQATYQQAVVSTSRLDIRAPAAGLVLERRVEPGQVVAAGSGMLFRMAKGGEIELLAKLGEVDLARIGVGQRAQVTPVGSKTAFSGEIWQLPQVIDTTSRQGIARIALGYDKALRPGGFASAKIISGAANVPLLPESAIQNDAKGSFVYIVAANNKIARRNVTVGDVSDAGVTVLAGLSGQEAVVLVAGAFLSEGDTIIPQRVKSAG